MLEAHDESALLPVYAQLPLVPVSGRGSYLYDADGQAYLDAYGGHAVASTGHSHPAVVRAIAEQAAALLFYSTALPHPVRTALAAELVARCPAPLSAVFFCNSGAEANENALHLSRKWSGRSGVIAVEGGFHGRTTATQALTTGAKFAATAQRAGMPLGRMVPFDDIAALEAALDDSIAAVIVEPVQGMAGARPCSVAFLAAARRLCSERGALLIFDEVQCGVGRTGHFTAAASFDVTPDLLTFAKGLASGLPIGAVITSSAIAKTVHSGDLGSTFGGGPVPCAAARATLRVIDDERLLENVQAVSAALREGALALGSERVAAVQGRGLLLGLKLRRPAAEVQKTLFARRILTGTSADPSILRLLPPLSFSHQEAAALLAVLAEVMQ